MGELFAADVRALAASMATLLNWAFSFTMTLVFAQLNAALGPAGTPLPLLGHLGQSRVISGHLGSSRARRHLLPLLGHLRRRRRLCGGVPPRDKGAESGGGAGALWQRGELEQARAQRHPSVERRARSGPKVWAPAPAGQVQHPEPHRGHGRRRRSVCTGGARRTSSHKRLRGRGRRRARGGRAARRTRALLKSCGCKSRGYVGRWVSCHLSFFKRKNFKRKQTAQTRDGGQGPHLHEQDFGTSDGGHVAPWCA